MVTPTFNRNIKITPATLKLLEMLVGMGNKETFGEEIARRTKLSQSTIPPILRRLTDAGWTVVRGETWEERKERAPLAWTSQRRYVSLTPQGKTAAEEVLNNRS